MRRTSPLLRTLDILEYLSSQPEPLTAQQTADATGVSRATLYRTLEDLVQAGWLSASNSPKQYSPSFRVIELGLRPLRRLHVREVVLSHLIDLSRLVGHIVTLSFYDRGDVVCTDAVQAYGDKVVPTVLGNRVPASVGAAGKILLANQPAEEIERTIAKGVPRFTDQTKTDGDEIRADIRRTLEQGYGVQDREYTPTSGGIACPVFDRTGAVVAAVAVGGRPTAEFIAKVLPPTKDIAIRASLELGYRHTTQVEVA